MGKTRYNGLIRRERKYTRGYIYDKAKDVKTKEDFEKVQASKSTDLLLDIIKKNTDKQEQPSLLGLEKLVR